MTREEILELAREAGLHSAVLLHLYDGKEAALAEDHARLLEALKHQRDMAHLMLQRVEKIGQQRDRMRAALARIKETKVFLGAIAGEMLDDALKEGIE